MNHGNNNLNEICVWFQFNIHIWFSSLNENPHISSLISNVKYLTSKKLNLSDTSNTIRNCLQI